MDDVGKQQTSLAEDSAVHQAPFGDGALKIIETSTTLSDGKELRATITTDAQGCTATVDTVPKGYFRDWRFIGTLAAFWFGSAATTGGYSLVAANLSLVNRDIGPSADINWVAFVYTLALAVAGLLVGRLTDLFGRRWLVLSGSIVGIVGDVVGGSANSVGQLIAGTAILGFSAAILSSYYYALAEIVPMKHRYLVTGVTMGATIPFGGFGPVIGKGLILHTAIGWRWCYYIIIFVHAINFVLLFLCYFPPTLEMKYNNRTVWKQLRDLDYVGIVLFTGGCALVVLALSWGGSTYPWKSTHVIVTIVVGGCTLIVLGFWEAYAKLKAPLLPKHLFKRFSWLAVSLNTGLASSGYFSIALIWPMMVNGLYTTDGGASMYAGLLASIPSTCFNLGQLTAALLAGKLVNIRIQSILGFAIGGAILASVATCGPDDKARACCLIAFSSWILGYIDTVMIVATGIDLDDQQEIGTAMGFGTSCRTVIPTLCSAVLISVLGTRTGETTSSMVIPALIAAGLPASSVPAMLQGFSFGAFDSVPGVTPEIITAGVQASQLAAAATFKTVFLVTLAFTITGMLLAFFSADLRASLTEQIAVTLTARKPASDSDRDNQDEKA